MRLILSLLRNFDNLRVATKFTDLAGGDASPHLAILGHAGIAWCRLILIGMMLAAIGAALLAILLWTFLRSKRREPRLVQ